MQYFGDFREIALRLKQFSENFVEIYEMGFLLIH